jgi:hypothetical protein
MNSYPAIDLEKLKKLNKQSEQKAVQQQQIQDKDTGFYYKEREYIEDSELYKTSFHIV